MFFGWHLQRVAIKEESALCTITESLSKTVLLPKPASDWNGAQSFWEWILGEKPPPGPNYRECQLGE